IHGSTSARPRTVVDFAVPFSPRTRTPPMAGLIEVRTRARPMSSRPEAVVGSYSQPTTAENGYFSGTLRLPLVGHGWLGREAGLRTDQVTPVGVLGSPQRACAGFSPASQILPIVRPHRFR